MTRLLAITDPGCEASTRYRISQFAPRFAADKVMIQIHPWSRDPDQQSKLVNALPSVQAVVIQRVLPHTSELRRLRRSARRLIYDFDDAVIYSESTRGRPHLRLSRWWRFRSMMRCCDAVTAGSNHLVALAKKHGAGERATLLPTVLETERYDREPAAPSSEPTIGWIGGRWTLPYLEQLREPLERLAAEIPQLQLRVIADAAPNLGRVRVELVPWSEATEIRELKRLTVGVAPLSDDAWSRGKCGLRLLQYLGAGIPAVTSPVGTQGEVVRAGAAMGAYSSEDWYRALRELLSNREAATRLAERGKQLVRQQFSVAAWAPRARETWCGSVSQLR